MCRVPVATVELRVAFRAGLRWPFRDEDRVEVWRGLECLGTISGETVRHLIQHHMAAFELSRVVADELSRQPVPVYVAPLKKPAAIVPFTIEQRASNRARRKRRKA